MPDSRVPRLRRFLVCEPRHFAVQYAINPWMHPDTQVDVDLARDQWAGADQRLPRPRPHRGHRASRSRTFRTWCSRRTPRSSWRAVSSARYFHAPQRRPESIAYETWFKAAGFDVYRPESVCEGEGDLVPVGRYVLAGTGFRTTREAHHEVQEFFGVPVISLQLVDPHFYHLDTALFVLDDENIAYYPEAFSPGSREVLARLFPDAVLATREDAHGLRPQLRLRRPPRLRLAARRGARRPARTTTVTSLSPSTSRSSTRPAAASSAALRRSAHDRSRASRVRPTN